MKEENTLSIIIPVHVFNDAVSGYLEKSIQSVVKQRDVEDKLPTIVMVYPKEIDNDIKNLVKKFEDQVNVEYVINEDDTDYQSQVNLAVDSLNSKYFAVLEFDDELSSTFVKNGYKYIETYDDIDIFLPMIIEVNTNNEGIKLTNESVWSQQFVGDNGEMGYLNADCFKESTDFKLSGAIINKESFKSVGGYKKNIKLTFMYEFLLRAINNTCKIFTIPKISYKHLNGRENSLFDEYQKNMPINERKFWFDVAAKEYNFISDRVIDTSKLENTEK